MIRHIKNMLRPLWHSRYGYDAREKAFSLSERLSGYAIEKNRFKKLTGYDLDLNNPKSFNQKVCWRKINDRNQVYRQTVDKYAVRAYLKDVLGADETEKILIPLLYVTDNPATIPFDDLPEEFVVKANHGSGTNIIIEKGAKIDRKAIIESCKKWLAEPYGRLKHEWAYRDIDRKIVVEQLIRDENGNLPADFKFHMFHGKCGMIQINQGHFADIANRTLTILNPDWKIQDIFWEYKPAKAFPQPANSADLMALAEKLSAPFDYVRIDLYSVQGRIYFGEFTFYPTSGHAHVRPIDFDYQIGALWNLPSTAAGM